MIIKVSNIKNVMEMKTELVENRDKKVYSIQCLRFLAATLVVIYHAYISFEPAALFAPSSGLSYVFGFGKVGVHIFFVISGYIMYLTSFDRSGSFNAGRFFRRRLVRIYPIYWVFVALYLGFAAAIGKMPVMSHTQFVGMLALVPSSASRVIGPAWTLSYEVYFYLLFGIVMMLGKVRGTLVLTILIAGSAVVGAVHRSSDMDLALLTNALLLEFLMGVWVARLTTARVVPQFQAWLSLAGAGAGYLAGLIWGYDTLPSALVWGVPSAFLVGGSVALEHSIHGRRRKVVGQISRLGDSSYSLYLCHILLISIALSVFGLFDAQPHVMITVAIVTTISIFTAAIFHETTERPITAFLNRIVSAKSPYLTRFPFSGPR